MSKLLQTLVLPFFTGFYESIHSIIIDGAVSVVLDDHEDDGSVAEGTEKFLSCEAMKSVHNTYCYNYVKSYLEHCNLPVEFKDAIKFESLDSPTYYNYTTDRIFCTVTPEFVAYMRESVREVDLRNTITEHYTARDGFIPGYDNTLSEWGTDLSQWDHNQLSTLFECWVKTCSDMPTEERGDGEYILNEWEIVYDLQANLYSDISDANNCHPNPDNTNNN